MARTPALARRGCAFVSGIISQALRESWPGCRTSRQNRSMTSDAPNDEARSVEYRVAHYRCRVADDFDALTPEQWDSPSWCSGWRIRDVLGHLVHNAEASRRSMARDVIHHPIHPDRGVALSARQAGDESVPALAQRLRQAQHGGVRVLGFPAAAGLGDVVVHGNDALRALGLEFAVDPNDAARVLDAYRRVGGLIFHWRPLRIVRLVATDVKWSCGNGPEVTGRAIDLVMLMANRRQIVGTLSGPGVADVAA
jgi:uncharacterized protein (TIGR03083 family)